MTQEEKVIQKHKRQIDYFEKRLKEIDKGKSKMSFWRRLKFLFTG